MTPLTWYPRGRWPSPCAACRKKIPSSSHRAHDPATNKFHHPECALPLQVVTSGWLVGPDIT